jgi:hypothetical protein
MAGLVPALISILAVRTFAGAFADIQLTNFSPNIGLLHFSPARR